MELISHHENEKICALHKRSLLKTNITGDDQLWYCDRVKVTNVSYTWKLEKFSSFNGETTSPEFNSPSSGCTDINTQWQLAISKISKIVILKVQLVASDQNVIKFQFRASIMYGGEIIASEIGGNSFCTATSKDVFIFPRLMECEDFQTKSDDTLTILCKINIVSDLLDNGFNSEIENCNATESTESRLFSDMSKLLYTGKFSDITLTVDGKELKAHKNILSLRSEVFAAMFDYDELKENTSNCIIIEDLHYDIACEMLRFIYSNKSSNLDVMALDLLAAADKYALKELKRLCELSLYRNIAIDTVLPILVYADRHSSFTLKLWTFHFIKINMEKIIQTTEWQTMLCNYIDLVEEIRNYNGCI
ncbi:protein roadkill-like [Haematobia irritans]|uniref:protein roadkill-like n=1 Tax=Haematobia irritans TaxID=7368 RepID=UPI003F4F9DA6